MQDLCVEATYLILMLSLLLQQQKLLLKVEIPTQIEYKKIYILLLIFSFRKDMDYMPKTHLQKEQ